MKKELISQAISQIDLIYIQEAMESYNLQSNRKARRGYQLNKVHRFAVCVSIAFFVTSFVSLTAFATNEFFRETVISWLYPIYSSDEIKEVDNGHMTGFFDERDTLLSFLDRFNTETMELGVLADNDCGYTYSLLSNSPDCILAIVQCNISNYKLLVTMRNINYENTTGIWQVISYQMITSEVASEMLHNVPEYDFVEEENRIDSEDSIIKADGACAIIYSANDKDCTVSLTEQESERIKEIFDRYTGTSNIYIEGLQNLVIKYADIMYLLSVDGNVLIMGNGEVGVPERLIRLSADDLESVLDIFSRYGILE